MKVKWNEYYRIGVNGEGKGELINVLSKGAVCEAVIMSNSGNIVFVQTGFVTRDYDAEGK